MRVALSRFESLSLSQSFHDQVRCGIWRAVWEDKFQSRRACFWMSAILPLATELARWRDIGSVLEGGICRAANSNPQSHVRPEDPSMRAEFGAMVAQSSRVYNQPNLTPLARPIVF
jgi:hypothetical protein